MSISKFEFTKRWTNPADFPTHETSEAQVRSDMQALHDEARNYIDEKLIPEVENELALKATKDEIRGIVLGQIPDGTLTHDKLSAELQAELDDKATKEDANNRYTKAETLSVPTKTNFGLPEEAIPDDVLFKLSSLNLHTWFAEASEDRYVVAQSDTAVAHRFARATKMADTECEFEWGDAITVDASGQLSFVGETTVATVGYINADEQPVMTGKYIKTTSGTAFYRAAGNFYTDYNDDKNELWLKVYDVFPKLLPSGTGQMVQSPIRDAYPDNGTSGDGSLHYTYLGVPFDNVKATPRIATGKYTGTGTYAAANANRVELDFPPRLFVVIKSAVTVVGSSTAGFFWLGQHTNLTNGSVRITVVDSTVEWYAESADSQLNTLNATYYYFALG